MDGTNGDILPQLSRHVSFLILRFLEFSELIILSFISSTWKSISYDEEFWKWKVLNDAEFKSSNPTSEMEITWRDTYIQLKTIHQWKDEFDPNTMTSNNGRTLQVKDYHTWTSALFKIDKRKNRRFAEVRLINCEGGNTIKYAFGISGRRNSIHKTMYGSMPNGFPNSQTMNDFRILFLGNGRYCWHFDGTQHYPLRNCTPWKLNQQIGILVDFETEIVSLYFDREFSQAFHLEGISKQDPLFFTGSVSDVNTITLISNGFIPSLPSFSSLDVVEKKSYFQMLKEKFSFT